MAGNVITFITVTALACLATVSGLIPLPNDIYCTTDDNSACTQRYPNSVCYHEDKVCKYGEFCQCVSGYADYSFWNGTTQYSCLPATVKVGDQCSDQVGKTCSGYRTYCNNNVCRCIGSYKPNPDLTDCIPLNLGSSCTNSDACGVNAYCDSRDICRCQPGYKTFNATDCTHYVPGETCSKTECDFTESGQSCGYGTCKGGVFECTWGSRWWQYSTPSGDPSPLVDGMCLRNKVSLVSTGELCDINVQQTSDYVCRSTHCTTCPEQDDVYVCNGAISSKTMTATTSLILLLACYLFN